MSMYPSTSLKNHSPASASAAHPNALKRPIPYTLSSLPACPHIHTHQVHHHTSHLHDSQWTARLYQSLTQHPSPHPQPQPPTLQLTALEDPIHQTSMEQYPPPPTHSCHHTLNLVTQQSRPPPQQQAYMYLHPQVVAPVAHVPIGAAHYAHLPPSIWNPPHAQYNHAPHVTHHQSPIHTLSQSPPHLHIQALSHVPPSHLHDVPRLHAPHQVYPLAATQPHLPHHEIHSNSLYQPHRMAYHAPPVPQTTALQPAKLSGALPRTALPSLACAIDTPQCVAEQASKELRKVKETGNKENVTPVKRSLKTGDASRNRHVPQSTEQNLIQSPAKSSLVSEPTGAHFSSRTHKVYTAVKGEDENQACPSNSHDRFVPLRQRGQQHSEQSVRKPRKPYTITKSREVWTQEEHARFVHALQLYDRDWKKIESYIGTKTVLQIRSHAQKHFGKVTKYKTGEYIPPPRPKKRAVLPYPRSRLSTTSKRTGSSGETGSESGGSDNATSGGVSRSGSIGTNGNSSATISGLRVSPQSDEPDSNGSSAHSLGAVKEPDSHKSEPPFTTPNSNNDIGAIGGSNHSYCNSAPGTSSQGLTLVKAQTLPSPTVFDVPIGARLPSRYDVKSMSGNNSREHSQDAFRGTEDVQNGVYARHESMGSKDGSDLLVDSKDNCKNMQSSMKERKVSEQSPDNPDGTRVADVEGSNHQAKSGNHSAVRAADGGRVPGPNNSLLVLSDCVDIVSGETTYRVPAAGGMRSFAAERVHGAQSTRSQKPPLPSLPCVKESEGAIDHRCTERDATHVALMAHDRGNIQKKDEQNEELILPGDGARRSPSNEGWSSYAVAHDEANGRGPHDPQRSSSGSGSNSGDGIAGLLNSDRPSGLSSAGSGSRGSPKSIDDGEEDPKSSNDGSGYDSTGQQSPPLRDPCVDPNSSLSRENSPLSGGAGGHEDMKVEASNREMSEPDDRRQRTMRMGEPCDGAVAKLDRHKDVKLQTSGERHGLQSIANLCSNRVSVEQKMRIENLNNRVRGVKRPRSASGGESRSRENCFKGGKEDVGDGEKRKRHLMM